VKITKLKPCLEDYLAVRTSSELIEGDATANLIIMLKALDNICDESDSVMHDAKKLAKENLKSQYKSSYANAEAHSPRPSVKIATPRHGFEDNPKANPHESFEDTCDEDDEVGEGSDESEEDSNDEEGDDDEDDDDDDDDENTEESDESESEPDSPNIQSIRKRKVDIKVLILPLNRAKGFTTNMKSGYNTIKKQLQKEYKLTASERSTHPRLEYTDQDGDVFDIKKAKDFEFVVRCHLKIDHAKDSILKLVAVLPASYAVKSITSSSSSMKRSQNKTPRAHYAETVNSDHMADDVSYLGSTIATISNEFGNSLYAAEPSYSPWDQTCKDEEPTASSSLSATFKSLFATAKEDEFAENRNHEYSMASSQDHSFSTRSIATTLVTASDIIWQRGDLLGSESTSVQRFVGKL
jgi:hypothetical protein